MTTPPLDHRRRVRLVQERVGQHDGGADALLVTDLVDIRWLTGFTGSSAWVAVTADDLVLGTDGRYGERALAETDGTGVTVLADSSRAALHQRLLGVLRGRRVALDPTSVSQAEWARLGADLTLVPLASVIGVERQCKDDGEIARMQLAAAAADAALADVEPMLWATIEHPVTEADVRNELEYRMRLHGADDRSYETIVAAGVDNAARPHHEPGRRVISRGDTVIIDVGALVDGYHSDMTRSYVIGEPSALQLELYELVAVAQRAGIAAVRSGVSARAVDSASRNVFIDAGYGDWYLHGTGHGVGLQIHEPPFHSQASDETIMVGNVVTVEPGLYRVGFGGFRIEDLLVVTEHGTHRLTNAPERPFMT